jgi:hypothetical protein
MISFTSPVSPLVGRLTGWVGDAATEGEDVSEMGDSWRDTQHIPLDDLSDTVPEPVARGDRSDAEAEVEALQPPGTDPDRPPHFP